MNFWFALKHNWVMFSGDVRSLSITIPKRVVLFHDTRSNDSQSNNAQFMHKLAKHGYFIKRYNSWYPNKKKYKRDKQEFLQWRKEAWPKKLLFQKLLFSLKIFWWEYSKVTRWYVRKLFFLKVGFHCELTWNKICEEIVLS